MAIINHTLFGYVFLDSLKETTIKRIFIPKFYFKIELLFTLNSELPFLIFSALRKYLASSKYYYK